MQIEQSLRELLWNPEMVAGLPKLVLSLGIAALLGVILGQVYIHFGHSLSNRRLFARNFLILVVTTTLIISIVRSSLALSLGLVGALSIVRFRAAIKEPEELAFLFLAISIGLGLGAGQALVTIVALAVILGLIVVRGMFRRGPESTQPLPHCDEPCRKQAGSGADFAGPRRRGRDRGTQTLRSDPGVAGSRLPGGLQASGTPGAVHKPIA